MEGLKETIKEELSDFQNPSFRVKTLGKAIFTHSKCYDYLEKLSQEELEELNSILEKFSEKFGDEDHDEFIQVIKEEFKLKDKVDNLLKNSGLLEYEGLLKNIFGLGEKSLSDMFLQMVNQNPGDLSDNITNSKDETIKNTEEKDM